MNLKSLSDSVLLSETKRHAHEERESGIQALHHIREIDARKLFATLGYSSLHAYCVKELGYSDGSAGRKIQAMRLIRDLPEYEKKLHNETVNETNLSMLQTFFNHEAKNGHEYSKDEKLELLDEVEGKSTRATELHLAIIAPKPAKKEKLRRLNSKESEIRFTASEELLEKLEKIKNLLGHQLDNQKYATLFEELADRVLKQLEPKKPATPAPEREQLPKRPELQTPKSASNTRYIPAEVKRQVWARDKGQCTFVTKDGKRCESKHALQYEHRVPFGKGGETSLDNLTLLCPPHNQLAAIQAYGLETMQRFFKSS